MSIQHGDAKTQWHYVLQVNRICKYFLFRHHHLELCTGAHFVAWQCIVRQLPRRNPMHSCWNSIPASVIGLRYIYKYFP